MNHFTITIQPFSNISIFILLPNKVDCNVKFMKQYISLSIQTYLINHFYHCDTAVNIKDRLGLKG